MKERKLALYVSGRDVSGDLSSLLYDALSLVKEFMEAGMDMDALRDAAFASSSMLTILGDESEEIGEEDIFSSLSAMLSSFSPLSVISDFTGGVILFSDGDDAPVSWSLKEKALRLWHDAETVTETLWVGGMLYAEVFRDMCSRLMRDAGMAAVMLGSLELSVAPYGLDWSSYFSSKYDVYYSVYEKAGMAGAFSPKGQALLGKKAEEIHSREEFFDSFLSWWDEDGRNADADSIISRLEGFIGNDRRVEIIRQLLREKERTFGCWSTFDPSSAIEFFIEEIRKDYYGGVYSAPGENDAQYECIVPQLREKWNRDR